MFPCLVKLVYKVFCNHLVVEEKEVTLLNFYSCINVLGIFDLCSTSLPHGALGWSVICD